MLVAVVICVLLAVPPSSAAMTGIGTLLRRAADRSGLPIRRPVQTTTVSAARYDALLAGAHSRDYPGALQRVDAILYARLGLQRAKRRLAPVSRVHYDPASRKLLLRRSPRPAPKLVVHELVRALIDQNFNLRRLAGLRRRDRDRALAAHGIVDGIAALASGRRTPRLAEGPLDRFLELEDSVGLGPGRALAAELRYLGGRAAVATALRVFPQTTEQLLHVDKFLERERALAVRLPAHVAGLTLMAAETFGELDTRALLDAFRIAGAADAAAGWGGGRIGLYTAPDGRRTAALLLRWDTLEDAAEWRELVPRYVAAAFPTSATVVACPPLDHCWTGAAEVAVGSVGERSVFASGPAAPELAAALLGQG
jgi:hypothetical protein